MPRTGDSAVLDLPSQCTAFRVAGQMGGLFVSPYVCWTLLLCAGQEHLVGILMSQQDQMRVTQLLIAINAAAVLLLLGFTGTWTASLVAASLLAVLLYTVGPELLRSLRWQQAPHAAGGLLRHSSVVGGQGLERQLSRMSRTTAGVPTGVS